MSLVDRPRVDLAELHQLIAEVALEAHEGGTILTALGERLNRAGLPVSRLSMAWRALHPLIYAQYVTWTEGGEIEANAMLHAQRPDPDGGGSGGSGGGSGGGGGSLVHHIVSQELEDYRVDLTAEPLGFELLAELAAEGHTAYAATIAKFSHKHIDEGVLRGVFFSFCTREPGGFAPDVVDTLMELKPTLGLAFRAIIESTMMKTLADTYLGPLAAQRVLDGAIRRGDAEVIPATIWYSDLRGFTPLAEELELDETIAFLNEVFEATAGAVAAAGGQVLDFIGDGVLAIFPIHDDGIARSLSALDDSLERLAAVRRRIETEDCPPSMRASAAQGLVGIALAVGDVRFGNIGTAGRLSFSVIGSTVNMVTRIEALTKMLREPVLVSAPVADCAPERFVLRGAFSLEGVRDRRALYGLAAR